jgi:hypothetical protein
MAVKLIRILRFAVELRGRKFHRAVWSFKRTSYQGQIQMLSSGNANVFMGNLGTFGQSHNFCAFTMIGRKCLNFPWKHPLVTCAFQRSNCAVKLPVSINSTSNRSNNITHYSICWSTFIHKSDPSPSRVYCIFTKLTNSNVLGKSPIRDSNNRKTGNCYWWIWQK